MGLVARKIEEAGIPTVAVSVLRQMTEGLPAPRNVVVRFRLGQVFGEPRRAAQQRAVVIEALGAFRRASRPGQIIELPYRWKRSRFDEDGAR